MDVIESHAPARPAHIVGTVQVRSPTELAALAQAASQAQISWQSAGAETRSAMLAEAACRIREHRRRLVELIVAEVGKPITEAEAEVDRSAAILRYHAESAMLPTGDTLPPVGAERLLYSERRPRGVGLVITPWNFPLAIPVWKSAPALAAGNSVLLKPAPQSVMCAEALAEVFAHLPAGTFTLVHGTAREAGFLIDDPHVSCVSITGSVRAGHAVVRRAARRALPAQAEMGGHNPSIVLADADLPNAARVIASAAMAYAGQKCTATRRIIVDRTIADGFKDALVAEVRRLRVGAPEDPATQVGPLISEQARDTALDAAMTGGRLLTGGPMRGDGHFMSPALVELDDPGARLAQEEVFGPVAGILTADGLDEAVELANGTGYGLVASVFTNDLGRALHASARLRAGLFRVNLPTTGVDLHAPFGGVGLSSYGPREQGPRAAEFWTTTHTVTIGASL
ncbi:aldehyde dehydrogenase [Nonomuraea sp. RK-328]|nr:aldehyde dehydrogenase [Nonomuraea sp. RK-328]